MTRLYVVFEGLSMTFSARVGASEIVVMNFLRDGVFVGSLSLTVRSINWFMLLIIYAHSEEKDTARDG